ncbi:putative iron-sulfur cluster-binding metallochaperone, partial [uncultured Chloroflexus sp.]|uniref:putative iron-sulfur cluster-binding metallochaperone n=1 Tax=uncultured Chloroflexus sp. TaxID=214040 RepID=UPI002612483F
MSENCCSQASAGSAVCELPSSTIQRLSYPETVCFECHQRGKAVQRQTVKALVSVSLRAIQDTQYYFCRTQSCPVVYYAADWKSTFTIPQLRERVYQKEPNADDVYVCYCFRYTVTEIRNASSETRVVIVNDIIAGIQSDQCACDLRNPQGSCCLGNVRSLMKQVNRMSTQ